MDNVAHLWSFLLSGYLATIAIETPVLLIGLSAIHGLRRRMIAGIWLTACTYPIVVLVLPVLFGVDQSQTRYVWYVIVAEIFAPVAECILFGVAFHRVEKGHRPVRRSIRWRDYVAIILANLASFGLGVWLF